MQHSISAVLNEVNSISRIPWLSGPLNNPGMQVIEQIYRARLQLLVDEAGSQRALSERIGKSPAQISQWINASIDSKTKQPRVMSRATAREIEKRFPKAEGWMDQPVDIGDLLTRTELGGYAPAPPVAYRQQALDIELLAALLTRLDPETRAEVSSALRDLAQYPDSRLAIQRARNALAHGGAVGLPTWRETAIEFVAEATHRGRALNPDTLISDIDTAHSEELTRVSAKSARTALTES
jgi:hypothetical protein